eukprot:c4622_g1_i1 orf=245-463(-)
MPSVCSSPNADHQSSLLQHCQSVLRQQRPSPPRVHHVAVHLHLPDRLPSENCRHVPWSFFSNLHCHLASDHL